MFSEPLDAQAVDESLGFDLLQELEQNTPDALRRQRTHFRIALRCTVVAEPGNASELLGFRLQGVTGDISEGGCRALFPLPVRVGDVYRLTFDRQTFDQPLTFARCVRCLLIREDAFEAGFQFFAPIQLPENVPVALAAGRD